MTRDEYVNRVVRENIILELTIRRIEELGLSGVYAKLAYDLRNRAVKHLANEYYTAMKERNEGIISDNHSSGNSQPVAHQ